MTANVASILNDIIFDSVKCLEFGKQPLHEEESKKQWIRNHDAFVNYIEGNLTRLREVYRQSYQDKPFYEVYLRLTRDVMHEMGNIIEFRHDLTHPQFLERLEMLLTLVYCVFSSCLGLGNMCLFAQEYPLTPDDMSMYMEMKVEETRRQKML
jgi:hypothetical protein